VHVSELGSEYFQYNDAAHELRGERTGRRFRLTDELHVQVSRVDLEARRIEFRLVQRFGFKEVIASGAAKPRSGEGETARRKAAPAKSETARRARDARIEAKKRPAPAAQRGAGKRKRRR
jgi:ribonuclease R